MRDVTPDRWERIGRLYSAASELPAEARAGFLRDACGDDHALRGELESLLASNAAAGQFLNVGAISDAAKLLAQERAETLVGTRLGCYDIVSRIGSGGMGEVYRARDSRLARDVAVKVLPALAIESDTARKRFHREAQAVAALSHPNIRALYDVGEADGRVYAVMELLDGETLRARLVRGALPSRKAMQMGAAIADGLAAAHARGIVHRDLKPENIFITTAAHVKVLDFGLAKMPNAVDSHANEQTIPGVILGTAGYMSPEQVSGAEVDARSDIFSLGCVLFEMTGGRRAFERPTIAETLTAILNDEPPELSSDNGALRRIVAHCLEKQPEARFQSAQDLAFQLRGLLESGDAQTLPAANGRGALRRVLWLIAGTVSAICLVVAAAVAVRREPPSVLYSNLLSSERAVFCLECGMAISSDGRDLAYVARIADEAKEVLWVRSLSRPSAQRLPGTEGARFPFWSPDGQTLGFFSGNTLYKIDSSGSTPPQKLCSPCSGQGTWSRDGIVVFGSSGNPLRGISAAGGDPFPVTELDQPRGDGGHVHPTFLPDGRHLLFRNTSNSNPSMRGIYAASLDSKATTLIVRTTGITTPVSKVFVAAGRLLFVQEGTVMAAPFDETRLRLKGNAIAVALTPGPFSVSETGILVYAPRALFQLAWLDRSGREIEALPIRGDFYAPRLSHDGRRVALTSFDGSGVGAGDIWVYDLARHVGTRITTDPAADWDPLWSPDDEWILFSSDRTGRLNLYRKRSTGVGTDEAVFASDFDSHATSWSRDGQSVIVNNSGAEQDLWQLSLPDGKVTRLLKTPSKESGGQISPDGKWIAYSSDETGSNEIYVQPFPPSVARSRVSTDGGWSPMWRSDGGELFYADANRKLMAVDVQLEPSFEASAPRLLFDATTLRDVSQYLDVTADGQRFLVVKPAPDAGTRPLTLVQNWTRNLKK